MKGRSIFWFEKAELRPLFARLSGAAPRAQAEHGEGVGEITVVKMDPRPRVPSLTPGAPPPPSVDLPLRQTRALAQIARSPLLLQGDTATLAAEIAAAAVDGLVVERASVWLYEAASGWLKGIASFQRSTSRHEIPGYLPAEQFPNFFAALASRMPLSVDDVLEDPRTIELVARHVVDPELRSFLAVPILHGEYLSGVLFVEHTELLRRWSPDDEAFASALASLLGLAIASVESRRLAAEHLQAEQRIRQQNQALIDLTRSQLIGLEDPTPAVREICRLVATTLHVDRCSVWLYNEPRDELLCQGLFLRPSEAHESGQTLRAEQYPKYFEALRSERAIVAHDAHQDPRTREFSESYLTPLGISSMLDAPIRVGDRMVGVLCHEHTGTARSWTLDEEQFAASMSDLLALVIEASERRKAEAAQAQRDARGRSLGEALGRLSRSAIVGQGDIEEALRSITSSVADALDVERCSVWIFGPDKAAIHCVNLYSRKSSSHESGLTLRAEQFPRYFEALRSERAIVAHDAHQDPRTREFSESYLTPLGISSMLDAPIRVGDRMVGVLCHEHTGPARPWSLDEERFAASVADIVALAMETSQRRQTEAELKQALNLAEEGAIDLRLLLVVAGGRMWLVAP